MRQSSYPKLRSALIALSAIAVVAAAVAPAYADERGDRRGHERHWRGNRGGVYVAPTYGYYDYGYPPPPAVYYPQPGINITIPLDIR